VTVFLGGGFAAKYLHGGGNFSVPLQRMLGLRRLKLDAVLARTFAERRKHARGQRKGGEEKAS
jgi:hypothetical protein